MRVVINHSSAAGLKTGVGHYTDQLVRHLRRQLGHYHVECFPRRWICEARESFAQVRQALNRIPAPAGKGCGQRGSLVHHALEQVRRCGRALLKYDFRSLCTQRQFHLYHEPNFIALPSDLPTVATLHDLSVLVHPEWHPIDRVKHFERNFARSLKRCQHFFAISEYCRREIIETLQIPPDRITQTYMGVREHLQPVADNELRDVRRRLKLPERYLLYLGTIEPRKNLLTLLKAYCALPPALRDKWPLLLVGTWGWRAEAIADYYRREARQRGVAWRAYVRERDLSAVYSGARALLYPSLYEGFGMPPLEMMACGGAVLSSTAGALRETVGRKAFLIEPLDVDGWRKALERVVTDDDWWRMLRAGVVETARPFTWERCAAQTLQAYRLLIGGRTTAPQKTAA